MNILPSLLFELPSKIILLFINAKKNNNKIIINSMYLGIILFFLTIITAIIGNLLYPEKQNPQENKIVLIVTIILAIISGISFSIILAYDQNIIEQTNEQLIIEKEKSIAENPNEPVLAWDLARIKLESYLNRNLNQIKSIYYWSIFVMFLGFGLIIYASYMAFQDQQNYKASLIAAISGIITNFIGATFLFIYKSITQQSENYVKVLERINAVGMSVQVIESISNTNSEIKDKAKADIAIKLIEIYSNK